MNAIPKQAWVAVKYTQTLLGAGTTSQGTSFPGGLDLTTPSLRLQPGALRDVQNFEVGQFGGYTRITGYERVDGHPAPSSATYIIVQIRGGGGDFTDDFTDDFTTGPFSSAFAIVPSVGDEVTQAVSGATGTIAALVTGPVAYLVLTNVAGAFDQTNDLLVGADVIGAAGPQTVSLSALEMAIYAAAAADIYRADIAAPPGEGPILGVVGMEFAGVDNLYAFRANVGETSAVLWKATPAGWVLVPYYNLIAFTDGGGAVALDGDILTQGGVTATIKRVMWQAGAWTGTADGRFVITDPAGGSFIAGAATTTSGATVTLSGAEVPITRAAGGRHFFEKCNFSGQLITLRIYGCDGVNPAFEFDGDTLAPIETGLSPDRPVQICFHKNILFLAQDASLIYSAAGNPFKWSAIEGGGEIATGDTITGMITLPGSQTSATLGVFMRGSTAFLYGTDPTTFNFVTFNTGSGAALGSVQNLFDTFFLDDTGVVTLKTSLNYGNFLPTTLTKNILPFISRQRGKLAASSVDRERSQYRAFFNDGYALYLTILNQQYLGAGLALYPDIITCTDTTHLVTGSEATYAGAQNGMVYRLDVGPSFDGAAISAYIVTAWDAVRSPRILKRFRAASIEVMGQSFASIQYGYQMGYNNDQIPQLQSRPVEINLGSAPHWDSFTWDAFIWDGTGLIPSNVDETGTAENIRVTIASDTNYIESYTVNSIIHHYSMRRGMRA